MSQQKDEGSDLTDNPLTECPNCGSTVLRDYVRDGTCPDCRDDESES